VKVDSIPIDKIAGQNAVNVKQETNPAIFKVNKSHRLSALTEVQVPFEQALDLVRGRKAILEQVG
jgi:hypothetical protein